MHTPLRHRTDEPDIGSGERSPGQHDTDKMIEQVPHKDPPQQTPPPSQPSTPAARPGSRG